MDKKEQQQNFAFVELSSYIKPEIVETINKEFVTWGKDNSYFDYLITAFNESPTNASIITSISNLIYGRGLSALDSSKKPNQYAQMISLFKESEVRKIVSDYKLLGKYALQVIYNTAHDKIIEVYHVPVNYLAPEKANDDGDIEFYYHSVNFANPRIEPKKIPAFGMSKEAMEILYVQPYNAGSFYFSNADYQSGVVYAEMEDEMSSFHINNLQNGFSATKFINFNNGVPDKKTQLQIEADIKKKWNGSKSPNKVVVAFNKNKDSAATIEDLQLTDASQQYQFLSEEATDKLLRSHRVTSPVLIGVKDNSGLGNNADELKTAFTLFDNTVIRPFQDEIIYGLDKLLAFNGISLKLYFKTLQPLEFTDLDGTETKETVEEETGVDATNMSADINDEIDLTDEQFLEIENGLKEDVMSDEWELVEKREYNELNDTTDNWANRLIKQKQSENLADVVKSAPNKESRLDKSFYKVRYEYAEKYSSGKSRQFCKSMMARTAKGVVYRKEDISQASFSGVNKSFGHKGRNYSLFRFKGGVNCGHFFNENLYRLKSQTEKQISRGKEVDSIPTSYTPKGKEYNDAKKAPKDMPNNGHHPNYKN